MIQPAQPNGGFEGCIWIRRDAVQLRSCSSWLDSGQRGTQSRVPLRLSPDPNPNPIYRHAVVDLLACKRATMPGTAADDLPPPGASLRAGAPTPQVRAQPHSGLAPVAGLCSAFEIGSLAPAAGRLCGAALVCCMHRTPARLVACWPKPQVTCRPRFLVPHASITPRSHAPRTTPHAGSATS
jgi:hypothetical protein